MSIINTKSCLPLNRQVENYLRQLIAQEKYQMASCCLRKWN